MPTAIIVKPAAANAAANPHQAQTSPSGRIFPVEREVGPQHRADRTRLGQSGEGLGQADKKAGEQS